MAHTMMLVDDIEMNRVLLKKIFQGEFDFVEADSGEAAIALLKERPEPVDILILDISMPGISGIELLHTYGQEPYLKGVPVVVVTSSDRTEDQLEAFDAGASDFVTKPFKPQIVRTRVHNVLIASQRLREIEQEKQVLKARASKDAMTGLLNKPSAQELIREKLAHCATGIHAMLMIDIDNFKGVNDSRGHLAGDRVIKLVARELSAIFRKEDVLSRFGGDEFCVFMSDLPKKETARTKAQALSGAILLQSDQEASIPFSVSIGLAYAEPGCTCEELTGWADEALYTSKENDKARISEYQFGADQTSTIQEVNETDAHMRNLLDRLPSSIGVMYYYTDGRMRFGYFNDGFYAMLGETRAERQHYIGNTAFESVHPADAQRAIAEAGTIVREGRSGCVEVRLRQRNGSYRWYQARAVVTERNEHFSTLYLSFLDIDDQRQQHKRLQEQQAIIDISTENGNIGLWLFDLDTRRITQDYARNGMEGLGRVVEDVPRGLIVSGLIHPASCEALTRCYEAILAGEKRSECAVQIYSQRIAGYRWHRIVLIRQADTEEGRRTAVGLSFDVDREVTARRRAEENERILSMALEFSGMYAWTYDVQQGTVHLSERLQKLLRLPAECADYPACILNTEVIHERYHALFREKTEELRQGADRVDLELQAYGPSGALHWLRLRLCVLSRAEGLPQTALCTSAVIDAEKTLEARVHLEQERTRSEENTMTAYVVADLSEDRIVDCSKAAPNAPLMPDTPAYSANIAAAQGTLVYDDDIAAFRSSHDAARLLHEFSQGQTACIIEFRRRQSDGMIRWTRNVLHLVEDPTTLHVYLYEYCYDINAAKSVEVVTHAAILLTFDCLASIDLRHGQTSYLRQDRVRRGENVLIADYPATVQDYLAAAVHPEDRARCAAAFDAAHIQQALAAAPVYEVTFRTVDEEGREHLMRSKYAYYDEKKGRCLMMRTDVTAIVREEEEKRRTLEDALVRAQNADRAKGLFLSRMTHELHTPLNAILGYTQLVKQHSTDADRVVHYMEQSRTAAQKLLSLVNDVLDLSAIETGRLALSRAAFDLAHTLAAPAEVFRTQAEGKQLSLRVSIEDALHTQVLGDPQHLQQILAHLLSNAIKFTPAGGHVALTARSLGRTEQTLRVQVQVEDSGIGMAPETLSRLFLPFEQESAATAQRYGGTGLGLTICHQLVRMMGGSLEAASTPGEGSVFTAVLAFELSPETTNERPRESRVLALAGDEARAEVLRAVLAAQGAKADVCTSTAKLLRRAANHLAAGTPYDLCLLDLDAPGDLALHTAAELKECCKGAVPLCCALSAQAAELPEAARRAGMSRLLHLPPESAALQALLDEASVLRPQNAANEKPAASLRGLRVLLAEDNAMNLEIALDILGKAGLVLTSVQNGQEAVYRFTASAPGTFEAILMDVQMPVMNGYEAARAIRRSAHPQAASIPIIAMTANAFTEDVTAALAAGMNDHLPKPISFDRLYAALSRLLQRE